MDEVRGFTRALYNGVTLASGTLTRVLGPYNLLSYPHKSFTLYNLSNYTLSGAQVRINADPAGNESNTPSVNPFVASLGAPNANMWEILDQSTLSNLVGSGVKTVHFSTHTARFWDVVAINDQPDGLSLTVSGYCHVSAI